MPSLFPLKIRSFIVRNSGVEFLHESPFVKFKPNAMIRSQGYRGTSDQFVYEWKTDKLGFKNLKHVSKLDNVDIVALGNSFTEGVGVATEKTWPSVLSENSYSTYNLGVQGYAPIQLEGSLRKFGLSLRPKYIIIGYFTGMYSREEAFFDIEKAIKNKEFTGGINDIVGVYERLKNNVSAKYLVSAFYLFAGNTGDQIMSDSKSSKDYEHRLHLREVVSVTQPSQRQDKKFSKSASWNKTLDTFRNIKLMSDSINAKTILLYFSKAGEVYFERVLGKSMPLIYTQKTESKLLQEFANENNMMFINLEERLRAYVNRLPDNFDFKLLPFLEVDGHMSETGNYLVAKEIMAVISKEEGRSDLPQ